MQAKSFTLKEMKSNNTVSLEDLKGKPTMITFWVSWCPDCVNDLRQKNQLYTLMNKEKLNFITINVPGRENQAEAAGVFLEENDYHFPVLVDNGTKTYDAYRCMGVPTTILLDKELNIVASYGDKTAFSMILKGLNDLL
jgi:peroxiredoxin